MTDATKPTEIKVAFDVDKLTWGDFEDLEMAKGMGDLIRVVDRFLVPPTKARSLPLKALKQVKAALMEAMKAAADEKN